MQAQLDALDAELQDAETYLKLTETLEGFRARLTANAENLTVEQRQHLIRLVVREVLIGEDDITIRHSIRTPTGNQPPGYPSVQVVEETPDPGAGSHRSRSCRCSPGMPERATHDYKRNGTDHPVRRAGGRDRARSPTRCYDRHGKAEFLDFLKQRRQAPTRAGELHVVARQLPHPQAPRRQAVAGEALRGSPCTSPRPQGHG